MNMAMVNDIMERATPVALHSPDHGPRHWRDVARIAIGLWAEGVEANLDVLLLFALLHDTQRENEYKDPEHGQRAAQVALLLKMDGVFNLSQEDMDILLKALMEHDKGTVSDDPTIGACWDADRLTLWRVGKVPDDKYLSTSQAKGKADITRRIVTGPDLSWGDIVRGYTAMTPTDILAEKVSAYFDDPELRRSFAMLHRHFQGGELCPELAACQCTMDGGMKWIMHPLIHQPFFELEAAHLNDRLKIKRAHAQEALEEGRFSSYVYIHERPYRCDAMFGVLPEIADDAEWWELVASVWTDSENIWQSIDEWQEIFEGAPDGTMTDEKDLQALADMPDVLTVYRGTCAPDGMGCGMSWTLDRGKAEWFAQRLHIPGKHGEARVIVGQIEKVHVLGYVTGRGEEEIVALPEYVTQVSVEAARANEMVDPHAESTQSDPADEITASTRSN